MKILKLIFTKNPIFIQLSKLTKQMMHHTSQVFSSIKNHESLKIKFCPQYRAVYVVCITYTSLLRILVYKGLLMVLVRSS